MIEGLSLERLGAEGLKVFLLSLPAFNLPVLEEMTLLPGWLTAASALASDTGEHTVAEAGGLVLREFLMGAGLPADFALADAAYERAWQAVAIHLHGLLQADPDEHESVIERTAAWIESQQPPEYANMGVSNG